MPWSSPTCPVLFINVEGSEQRSSGGGGSRQAGSNGGGDGGSYSNPAEAEVAMKVLLRVLQQDEGITSIALLSPYRCVGRACPGKRGGGLQAVVVGVRNVLGLQLEAQNQAHHHACCLP